MKPHSIDISEKSGVRYLHFGSHWVQGAMRIKRPIDLELAYAQHMMFGLLLRKTCDTYPARILQIGLGAGSLVKWCHYHLPQSKITAVEIDPRVYAVARQFFNLPHDNHRLSVIVGDGIDYLREEEGDLWDLILLDAYDAQGLAGAFDSEDFYRLCRTRLAPNGLLSVNLLGLPRTYPQSLERIRAAFTETLALAACDSGNRVVLAGSSLLPQDTQSLLTRASHVREATGLDLRGIVERSFGGEI